MAITPTVLIAAKGMLNNEGVGVNTDMTTQMSAATGSPITSNLSQLQAQAAVLALTDPVSAAAILATLSTMPNSISNVNTTSSSVSTQAAKMSTDVKTFISLHSSSTAFGSASAEYGAAISQFGDKSFGDLGIGVKNFTDANSGGITSLAPALGAISEKAKSNAFGGLGTNLDPALLAKGEASMSSSSLKDGLSQIGTGLGNFGNLFDFKNPNSALTYTGLYVSLQQQGLSGSIGIDDAVSAAGYDPKKPVEVPSDVLINAYKSVSGSDLKKVISQTGSKPVKEPQTLYDLTDPSFFMSPGATNALGIKPGSGIAGLQSVGNTMTNIGVPMDNATAKNLIGGMQTKVGPYLGELKTLVPQDVKTSLQQYLGKGSSPFGTPGMSDMMGSVGGKHTDDFAAVGPKLGDISSSPSGQSLSSAMQGVMAAIASGSGLPAALTNLNTATTNFNTQMKANPSLSTLSASIDQSMNKVNDHLNLEKTNLSLAGVNLDSPPATVPGSAQILSFASKLHSFGVDKQQLGHNDVLNGVAADNLTGDAIKASLLEGKNVAAMAAVGKIPPSTSNQTKALADANAGGIDSALQQLESAFIALKNAREAQSRAVAAQKASPSDPALQQKAIDAQSAFMKADDNATMMENKVYQMAVPGSDTPDRIAAIRQKYTSVDL